LDLDDLLVLPVRLMKEDPSQAAEFSRQSCRHLLVDEFQDVNRAQYEIVRSLAPEHGEGLFIIGDPDQAIYGFRGADRRFFTTFREAYPAACPVRLRTNYRSQAIVLEAAEGALGCDGEDRRLIPHIPQDTPVRLVQLPNPKTEGEFICRTIDSLVGGASFHSIDSGRASARANEMSFRDFAVLYRLNAVGDALEEAFSAAGIPYQRASRSDPKEEAEALDPRAEAVTLMTIHAAKGLEFPVVFVAGCEEGIIPYTLMEDTESHVADVDEERRLLYVAMTRAAKDLFLTRSAKRSIFGRTLESPASSFLAGLQGSLVERIEPLKRDGTYSKKASQCELFSQEQSSRDSQK
jgi:DNA helicase-2/ATP-dependent DNA helicase PcrA